MSQTRGDNLHWCPQQYLRRNVRHDIQPYGLAESDQISYSHTGGDGEPISRRQPRPLSQGAGP